MPHAPTHALRLKPRDDSKDPCAERLILAAAEEIAGRGAGAVSARSVALAAGAAASAVNYNFGGIERLFSSAFAHGVLASGEWMQAREREIEALPRTARGAALALEHVIAAWTGEARSLALLYQEALAAGAGSGAAADWTGLWRDFWLRAAGVFGLGQAEGRLMHLFFESEALYNLSTWSPALERAAQREMCDHLAAVWLGAEPVASTGALELAERAAGVLREGAVAPSAVKIVEAAAALVEEGGLGALTHRAVAARAGVTTGSVTHHFRTVEDLVAGMIRGQVSAMERTGADGVPRPRVPAAAIGSVDGLFDAIGDYVVTDRPWGPALRRRRLFLAAIRRPELAGAGAVIRFAHGGTVGEALDRLFEIPPGQESLYAGVLSRLIAASWFACSADPDPRAQQTALVAEVKGGIVRGLPPRRG